MQNFLIWIGIAYIQTWLNVLHLHELFKGMEIEIEYFVNVIR